MNMLSEKLGPLPVWQWGALGAVGLGALLFFSSSGSRKTGSIPIDTSGLQGSVGTTNTADVAGNLSRVEAELQQILSGQNAAGTIAPGITANGASAIESFQKQTGAAVFSLHSFLEERSKQVNAQAESGDISGAQRLYWNTLHEYQGKVNETYNNLQNSFVTLSAGLNDSEHTTFTTLTGNVFGYLDREPQLSPNILNRYLSSSASSKLETL